MNTPDDSLQVLLELMRDLSINRPAEVLLAAIAQTALKLLPGKHSSLRLFDETGSTLLAGARAGEGADKAPVTFAKGQGILGWVAEQGLAARVGDCSKDSRFLPSPLQGFEIQSLLAVPLFSRGEVIGVLAVSSPEREAYSADHELLAKLLANCAVPALEAARAEQLTLTDRLTGAFNHRFLRQRLGEEFARARRSGAPLSLLALDLDHFRNVNDRYELNVGDQVIASFAERTRQLVRRYDVLVRLEGGAFALVMPSTTIADAITVATRIRDAIGSLPLCGGDTIDVRVTVSVGAVEWDRVEDPEQLEQRAEGALREAKQRGRNRVVVGS